MITHRVLAGAEVQAMPTFLAFRALSFSVGLKWLYLHNVLHTAGTSVLYTRTFHTSTVHTVSTGAMLHHRATPTA